MQQPIISFRRAHAFLRNPWYVPIFYEGISYDCVENAYQAAKFPADLMVTLPSGETLPIREHISKLEWWEAKKFAREMKACVRIDFRQVQNQIMLDLTMIKYAHPGLKKKLLETGERPLIEGNTWHDNYWGDCSCTKCVDIPGLNVSGQTIMIVRDWRRSN